MRIVTWNLERGFHRRRCVIEQQQDRLAHNKADIVVRTEVPARMSTPKEGIALSPAQREGDSGMEAWVSIAADRCHPLRPELPFERMAVAAQVIFENDPFLIYGSVLPWPNAIHQAPYLARPGESPIELFARVLREQVNDMADMRKRWPDHTLIWAGDFNQTLSGPNRVGSKKGRQLLFDALAELDLVAWNKDSAHANPWLHAIDLICGPSCRRPRRVERFEPTFDGGDLSDHAGYLVEI